MKTILSWLLHHANRNGKNEHFYAIKNRLIKKYGVFIGYDVQFIEGKKCWSCGETGVYKGINWRTDESFEDKCWHCLDGWYKSPVWNILGKYQFGKYTFHQPYQRVYSKPDISSPVIEGYIEHKKSRWSSFACFVLFLLFEKNFLKRYYRESGNGWYLRWWRLENIGSNLIHLLKYRNKALPFRRKIHLMESKKYDMETSDDSLPF